MKKNIKKVKKFQKPLICLLGLLLILFGVAIDRFINANADEINYEYQSNNIGYDSTNNSLNATNVKDAIDELYSKVGNCPSGYLCLTNSDSIVAANGGGTNTILQAYHYDENNETALCVTGEEENCKKTVCYLSKNKKACAPGTIIDYKVNDTEIVRFHVLHDDGDTMTMQSQRSQVIGVAWHAEENDTSNGPDTILPRLESQTSGWSNVKDIQYNGNDTKFVGIEELSNISNVMKNNNNYCRTYDTCERNTYTYPMRTVKARMIMLQEAVDVGCTVGTSSCPKFMYNYLNNAMEFGATKNDNTEKNYGYWTMSAYLSDIGHAWIVYYHGNVTNSDSFSTNRGARAVVVVNK